ncbi:hypothetical protein AQUCO_05500042v1 [Aquilegia coerulea]|uniref:Knottins-like domain-containing protein n=1 Tax=Aquilegia coerulea TaxID=218851 RepID=A0A2G5CGV0_AQUCA|nr:hypothetical protein AQUCO_05500042v1 [Aquilegia coerulea]
MAKSATFFTVLFAFLVLFAAIENPMMVEAKTCERGSGTWSGLCGNDDKCKDQCIQLEGAQHGSCNLFRCVCYFPC